MGFHFDLDHASLVGWLTRRDHPYPYPPGEEWWYYNGNWERRRRFLVEELEHRGGLDDGRGWRAPRATTGLLESFLEALPNAYVTRDRYWMESLREVAGACRE